MSGNRKEQISNSELFSVIFLFIVSSAMVMPVGAIAGNKSWISIIAGMFLGTLYTLIFIKLYNSYPGKSIIEIGESLIGKWGGKIIGLLYALFSLQTASYMMKDHWYFTAAVALPNTPVIVVSATMMIMVIWITYAGIEAIGRISIVFVPIFILYTLIAFILLSKDMNFRNFLPLFDNKWSEVLYAVFQVSILPFGGAAIFSVIFPYLDKKGQAKKTALLGVIISGMFILIANITNILVLGPLMPRLLYPTYTSYSYVQIADFLDRAEITIFTLFISINFIQMSVALCVSALCIAKVFRIDNYRIFLIPLGLLMLEQSMFIVRNHAEFIRLITYAWQWYAMIFIFLIPLLLLIVSVIRKNNKWGA